MSVVRGYIKTSVLACSWVLAKLRRTVHGPAILMYHSFDSADWRYGVSPKQLQKQLAFLTAKRQVVSLDQCIAREGDVAQSDRMVAITIDDGYADTYEIFFPLAKKYNLPFTIFLTTDLSPKEQLGNLPRPTWDQLREMVQSGLATIGLHGHSHVSFVDVLNQGQEQQEILYSEQLIKEELGVTPMCVAYPSGKYNDDVISYFSHRQTYTLGLTAHSGFVSLDQGKLLLRRVEVNRSMSYIMFKLRLTAALEIYNACMRWYKFR